MYILIGAAGLVALGLLFYYFVILMKGEKQS